MMTRINSHRAGAIVWGKKWGDDAGVGSVGEGDEGYDPTWIIFVVVGLDRAGVDVLEQILGFDNDIDMLGGSHYVVGYGGGEL